MLFNQHQSHDLWTPAINDGGVSKLNSSLTSLDFYLLDDIDAYLPPIQSKKNKNDLINDSTNANSQHQEDFLLDFDFVDINQFEEKSDFLDDVLSSNELDIEKWISQSAFPSPHMDLNNSPLSTSEDTCSTSLWSSDDYPINVDMIVPPSPSLSSTGSSPAQLTKKGKLSITDRKIRKKGQNKSAAEKYRIKKKSERSHLLERHFQLKHQNKELKSELDNLTFRVQQFKQLCVDLLQIDTPKSI